MAEVAIKIIGEEAEAVQALEATDKAMETIRDRAVETAAAVENLSVPVDRYTKQLLELNMEQDTIVKSLEQMGYSAEVAEESFVRLTGEAGEATTAVENLGVPVDRYTKQLLELNMKQDDIIKSLQQIGYSAAAAEESFARLRSETNEGSSEVDDFRTSAVSSTRAFYTLRMGLAAAGVQTRALGVGIHAATVTTMALRNGVTSLSIAFKGLWVSLGPIGVTLIAIAATVTAILYLWNRHKKALEDQEEGLKAVAEAATSAETSLTALWAEVLRLRDAEAEATKTEAWEEYNEEMKTIRKDYEDALDGMEKAAGGFAAYMRRDALEAINAATREALAKERLIKKLEGIVEEQAEAEQEIREASEDAFGKQMQAKIDMAKEARDEIQRIESERMKSEYETGEQMLKNEKKRNEEIQRDKERVTEAARILRRMDLEDAMSALQEQQEAFRAARPEFKAEFVGLEEMGRRIQAAAAGIGEPEEVKEIQKRIEEHERAMRKMEEEERELRREAYKKIVEGKPVVAAYA